MTGLGARPRWEVVSRHFLRRRARKAAWRLRLADLEHSYVVLPARRGPFRWLVERRENRS